MPVFYQTCEPDVNWKTEIKKYLERAMGSYKNTQTENEKKQ